ncbi:ATP-grasp domain-containing protein [Actinomycetospora endophytica]|uniref:ATP-grasp domain-containing protein n=1 Tax=Actinomycetospora endophytica TaxID=2291215 RepID=A0ABS8P5B5_9PSEU|nr:carboxyl transferase domain-containing protein [Actinomycetospora endophytica]MCD2193448.1 ATP-grasp domain-containing protein [Actinomycetospora endophytica]
MASDEGAEPRPVGRIAIINRGEAAVRLIHAVRDLNAERRLDDPVRTIALYTDAEPAAMFVREADVAYSLGAAADRPYLDHDRLEAALVATGADAVWVGWGFVAEDAEFAARCARLGVTFVGPSADAMRRLGDKIGAKQLAEEVGVPVAPWSGGAVSSLDEAVAATGPIGYPLVLKAAAGGGGRGIRLIRSESELREAYQPTRDEARRAFGSDVVFLEALVTGARHVEVQVIADAHGTAWALGVRDCSVQRRNQKVIEESASPLLDAEQTALLRDSAERLAVAVGYCGAATVEFLYRPEDATFAFLEVNTRLQVEHPVTEITTGTDLVRLQLHVAGGGRLGDVGDRPVEVGHAVEARLNAEDPDREFAPSPGRIELLDLPSGPGVRVDTGVSRGDVIPSEFDSMIAKIIASGRTREEALARLRRALAETAVVIEGGVSNKSFLLDLLHRPEVIDGTADTGWIDRVRAEGGLAEERHAGTALVAAAVEAYESEELLDVSRLLETARGGRPYVQHRVSRPFELTLRGHGHRLEVSRVGARRFRVTVDDEGGPHELHAEVHPLDAHHSRLVLGGRTHRVLSATHGPVHFVEVDGVAHRVGRDEGGVVRAPAPALVVATPVAVGDEVAAGAPVLVLESMKMETQLHAPFVAVVKELHVGTGDQVETGAALARLEPVEDDDAAPATADAAPDLDLPATDEPAPAVDDLRAVLLGYDVTPADEGEALERYLGGRDARSARGEDVHGDEIELLGIFADFAELSRNRPADEEASAEMRVHSPREYFHTYLQSLDVERGGLPELYTEKLRSVVRHYGVSDLTRTPALERVVFRVFLAQQRSAPELAIVTAILQRWLGEPAPSAGDARTAGIRELLERLVQATQRRFPAVGDLARSVRYRWFDEPAAARERDAALERVAEELAHLDAHPDAADRAERIEALAGTPERIVGLLANRLLDGLPVREALLETLVRRHYRGYELRHLGAASIGAAVDGSGGRPGIEADYVLDERPTRLVSTVGSVAELDPASAIARSLAERVAARAADQAAVVDLYLAWPEAPTDPDECSAALHDLLLATPFALDVRRVAVAVCAPGQPVGYFTFRPAPPGLVEDDLVRGVHPMVGRRLDLWRLRDFDITRLEAPDDVLLYHAVAPENPADQRLVALAQARELTVVRDAEGRVSSLPQVERAIAGCVEGIRRARAQRATRSVPLDMNHVWVHIWPPIAAELEQVTALRGSIAPITSGAGIDEVLAQGHLVGPDGEPFPIAGRFYAQPGAGVQYSVGPPPTENLAPMDDYGQKVMRARRRGTVYPYEIFSIVAGEGGGVVEHDLDDAGSLVPVDRPAGGNKSGIVVGVATTPTDAYPEGITRVLLCGDPTKALGAVSEPECSRIVAALDLAEAMAVPVEWYTLSAGARIAMDSGTENMDWVARGLKRIIEFTQAGGEIHVVVAGINVGAQPYWNAEATMLMHTKGILVMTPDSAMVLTGKQSLDFSGGVSAEDNFGIGGYDRVMGPNGQAQYWAPDLGSARDVVLAHYEHAYIVPGEAGPRRVATTDPTDRDITTAPHHSPDSSFTTVGEIFSATTNPDRKKAFDIRTVMRALADADHPTPERWAGMADADTAVVLDAHIGGHPVCLLGIESRAVPRRGFPPTDGPDTYTAGTLFPKSSKKAARAINAASGNRPVVVLANLSGFDGSPDSMRNVQLEYGAEIGRAVVNFDGPIVFVVISRYHGGAFVVFSRALNPRMTVLAVEGSFASVIGGAPAAAVVFAAEVDKRTDADERVVELSEAMRAADEVDRASVAARWREVRASVRAEYLGAVAAEFDGIHSIHRAVEVGSVDAVISAHELRPRVIGALDG